MSNSETPTSGSELLSILDQLHRHIEAMSTAGAPAQDMTADSVSQFVADAARLYSAVCAAAGREIRIDAQAISATQAIMLIHALMESQTLNTFDLALWRSPDERSTTNGRVQHQ